MVRKKTKLFLHLKKWLEKASIDYNMIEPGDRLLVGISGGADKHGPSGSAQHLHALRPERFQPAGRAYRPGV